MGFEVWAATACHELPSRMRALIILLLLPRGFGARPWSRPALSNG